METKKNKALTPFSKELRKNMTDEEKHLWFDFLRLLSIPVKRQRVINRYIVDFYIPCAKLVIELDGSQHYEQEALEADRVRDDYLSSLGLTVLRFTNRQINTCFKWVCDTIQDRLKQV